MPGNSSSDDFDVFISFASPDRNHAEDLFDYLTREEKLRVFLDSESIAPGKTWDDKLSASVRNSRVVAVLLSENSAVAHYQREEIHLAVELARAGDLEILPIYVEGPPAEPRDWEFGLRAYQRIDFQRLGLEATALKITEAVAELSGPRGTGGSTLHGDSTPRRSVGEMLHGAALRIDRTRQWEPLTRICKGDESALFLLHGPRQQNLDFFVSRIWRYLGADCGRHHHSIVVPLNWEFAKPRTAAAWEIHLQQGLLEEGSGRAGTAEELLRDASRTHPVFIVLSRLPIATVGSDREAGLDEVEVEALEEFLSDRLPGLISRSAKGRHPIRALLATHYRDEKDSLVDRLDTEATKGCGRHGVRYRRLPPVRPLEWDDIESFLDDFPKRPPKRIYRELREIFESLEHDTLQFRDILDLLARKLF